MRSPGTAPVTCEIWIGSMPSRPRTVMALVPISAGRRRRPSLGDDIGLDAEGAQHLGARQLAAADRRKAVLDVPDAELGEGLRHLLVEQSCSWRASTRCMISRPSPAY